MQTAANGENDEAAVQEGEHQFFGCEASRAIQEVDTELVAEELGPHVDNQVFLLNYTHHWAQPTLLDPYLNLMSEMLNSIVTLGAHAPVEYHRFPSILQVKRLVAQEDPVPHLAT